MPAAMGYELARAQARRLDDENLAQAKRRIGNDLADVEKHISRLRSNADAMRTQCIAYEDEQIHRRTPGNKTTNPL